MRPIYHVMLRPAELYRGHPASHFTTVTLAPTPTLKLSQKVTSEYHYRFQ